MMKKNPSPVALFFLLGLLCGGPLAGQIVIGEVRPLKPRTHKEEAIPSVLKRAPERALEKTVVSAAAGEKGPEAQFAGPETRDQEEPGKKKPAAPRARKNSKEQPKSAPGVFRKSRGDERSQRPVDYDVVVLKNGQEFVGRVTQETKKTVTILFRGGEIVLPRRRVKKIVRAERAEVERKAAETVVLGRYQEREEFYFVYYRGRRVGWRKTSVTPRVEGDKEGYSFLNRTIFMKKNGGLDMDLNVAEFVDRDLRPVSLRTTESSEGFDHVTRGAVVGGHLKLLDGVGTDQEQREILFDENTEFLQPLIRRLADMSHFPEAGEDFKIFDSIRSRFVIVHARRTLRKEIVAGKHQFVTVWRLQQGERGWEVWVDGYGGIVREELGGPHMVALRADPEAVMAYARGEAQDGDSPDLTLEYENVPSKFRLARPNLTWSFEFPEFDSPVAITLLNPTLQASVDVVVLNHVDLGTAPETLALDLMSRMGEKSQNHNILFQKKAHIGGAQGIVFESTAEKKGVMIRTIGAMTVSRGRAYALLLAAPALNFEKVRGQLERILESFEIIGAEQGAPAQ